MGAPVARPGSARSELLWVAEGKSFTIGTGLTVGDGERALLFSTGRVAAELGPGPHVLDPNAVTALYPLASGPLLETQIVLVSTDEVGWIPVGGGLGTLPDPTFDEAARMKFHGTCSARVTQGPALLARLGTEPSAEGARRAVAGQVFS